jgi:hypothetical protein
MRPLPATLVCPPCCFRERSTWSSGVESRPSAVSQGPPLMRLPMATVREMRNTTGSSLAASRCSTDHLKEFRTV